MRISTQWCTALMAGMLFVCQVPAASASTQETYDVLQGMDDVIAGEAGQLQVPGLYVAVVQDNAVIYEYASGVSDLTDNKPFTGSSSGRLASATKFLSSMAFLAMAERGVFQLNDKLGDLYAPVPAAWRNIPVWRVLNHTSGIPMVVTRQDFNEMKPDEQMALDATGIIAMISEDGLDFEPGTGWHYQQSGYAILAKALEVKTGKSWNALLQEYVFGPAGMTATAFTTPATGQAPAYQTEDGVLTHHTFGYIPALSPGGGYDTTGRDMANLIKALNSDRILPRGRLASMVFKTDYLHPVGADVQGEGYGLATIVQRFQNGRTIGHSGGGGLADIRYSPEAGLGIIVLTNRTGGTGIASKISVEISRRVLGEEIK